MLHVNDDTNDELFRKAADDYFLKADTPDWESLLNKMATAPGPAEDGGRKKNRNSQRLLYFYRPLKKKGHKILQTLSRIFRMHAGLEKSKKKINAGILHSDANLFSLRVNSLNSIAVI